MLLSNERTFLSDFIRESKLNVLRKATFIAYGGADTKYLNQIESIYLFDMFEVHYCYNTLNSKNDNEITRVKDDFIFSIVDRARRSVYSVCGVPSSEEPSYVWVKEWEALNLNKAYCKTVYFKKWLPDLYLSLHKICSFS